MNQSITKPPTSFWIISIVGLVWNLIGIMNFMGQAFMSKETLAQLPEEQREVLAAVPSWIMIVFAIAVLTGTLGCIGLLLRKSWAVPVFLVSLIAVVIQMGWNLIVAGASAAFGPMAIVMTILVIVVAVFLYYYSKQSLSKGILS